VLEKYARDGGSLRGVRTIAQNLRCATRVIYRLLKRRGLGIDTLRRSAVGNHKVVAIRHYGVAAEVYDLYVEKRHCFAAGDDKSWVIVHNSDESTETDSERKHVVMVKAKSKVVKEAIEEFLYQTINIDSQARPSIRYLCKYGDMPFEIVPTKDRDAVASLRFMNVYNFTRVETKHGDLVGFFFQDELVSEPEFLHPWSVVHMRLTSYENIYHPYGRSILDPARKGFKQLRLMEDAALIYRITRAPERRVFKIPVGNIPTKEVYQYLEAISKQFKKRKIFNPATGEVDERWSPLIQEDDYWLPTRPDGGGPEVTTLPGGQNLDQIADIVYFKKKVLSAMKIPFAKVGLSEGTGEEAMKRASHISPEFATAVQWVQREYLAGLKKAIIVHLALKGFRVQDLKDFDLFMTASSAIDELYRIETWKSRSQVIGELKDTGLFPDKWIVSNFTDLTDEEIEDLAEQKKEAGPSPEEAAAAGGEAGIDVPPVPEGYDADAEKQVLMEEGLIKRPSMGFGMKYNSKLPQFEKLLNSNEFDGMKIKDKMITSNVSEKTITEAKSSVPPPPSVQNKKKGSTQFPVSSEPTEADLPPPAI
jgi:hypothetical protein